MRKGQLFLEVMPHAVKSSPMKAIGFDFGDTLIYYPGTPLSWKSLYPDALAAVASGCNYEVKNGCIEKASSILEAYNTRINPRSEEVVSDVIIGGILECWGVPHGVHLDNATETFFTFFQHQVALYDDARDALRLLKEKGLKIGILTDVPYGMKKEFVQRDLDAVGIDSDSIDILLTSVDVGYRKPHTAGFIQLASELGAKPHEMLFVGNEKKDVEGANAAGVYSVLICREEEGHQYGQRRSIESLREVVGLLP